jgi:hypothetical protein
MKNLNILYKAIYSYIGIEDSQGNRIVGQSEVLKIKENYIRELYNRLNRPETLEVETEKEVDADKKGSCILQSEVEEAINEMRNKKATEDDDVPGDVLKLLGEGGLKIIKNSSTPYMKLESGPKSSQKLNDCLKEEATSYKMRRPSHNQPYRTQSKDSSKDI